MTTARRLSAIMFTDIVGYTALMQRSEREALQIRQKHRRIFELITQAYGGQIIQYYGDGTLSIFNSTVSAVKCTCALQQQFLQEGPEIVGVGPYPADHRLHPGVAELARSLPGPGKAQGKIDLDKRLSGF